MNVSFDFVSIYFKNIGECHSILQYFIQICAKCLALPAGTKQRREGWSNYVECPLLSALLYARGPTSTVRSSMYSFFFKVMPLAACSWFSAATGSFLCRNEFSTGVLDIIFKIKILKDTFDLTPRARTRCGKVKSPSRQRTTSTWQGA